jgi:hypothetical protein
MLYILPLLIPQFGSRKIETGYYLATPAPTLHRAVRLTQQTRNGAALGRPESPAHLAPQRITSAARRPSSSGRLRCRRSELQPSGVLLDGATSILLRVLIPTSGWF